MKKIIKGLLLILCLWFIYYMSDFPDYGSSVLSSGLLRNIAIFFRASNVDEFILKYHGIFRKMAHFGEYFILGVLLYLNMIEYTNKKNILTICIVLCMLYAASDEIHQYFVPGRYCSIFDVLIDTLGSVTGLLIIHLINLICYREKKH